MPTLIELLVVIAITVILIALLLPAAVRRAGATVDNHHQQLSCRLLLLFPTGCFSRYRTVVSTFGEIHSALHIMAISPLDVDSIAVDNDPVPLFNLS